MLTISNFFSYSLLVLIFRSRFPVEDLNISPYNILVHAFQFYLPPILVDTFAIVLISHSPKIKEDWCKLFKCNEIHTLHV